MLTSLTVLRIRIFIENICGFWEKVARIDGFADPYSLRSSNKGERLFFAKLCCERSSFFSLYLYSYGTLDFFFHQKAKLELICCVLVGQLSSAKTLRKLFQFTTVSSSHKSIQFRTQVTFPLRHVLLASSTMLVKSS